MIQIIAGEKGKGKTKVLIAKANEAVRSSNGSIVYLDKSNKHMYELSNKIRLINVTEYLVKNGSEFVGFISGIISGDRDIEAIYLDSFMKMACITSDELDPIIEKLECLSTTFQVDFVISISVDGDSMSENLKKDIIVAL